MVIQFVAYHYITHTIQVSSQCQACSKSIERYHNSCNPQNKSNKTQNKIFLSFWNFSMFLDFFLNKKQPINQKQPKTETKHVQK